MIYAVATSFATVLVVCVDITKSTMFDTSWTNTVKTTGTLYDVRAVADHEGKRYRSTARRCYLVVRGLYFARAMSGPRGLGGSVMLKCSRDRMSLAENFEPVWTDRCLVQDSR